MYVPLTETCHFSSESTGGSSHFAVASSSNSISHRSRVLWEKQKMARISLRVWFPVLCAVLTWLQHRAPHLGLCPVLISVVTVQLQFLKSARSVCLSERLFFFKLAACLALPSHILYNIVGRVNYCFLLYLRILPFSKMAFNHPRISPSMLHSFNFIKTLSYCFLSISHQKMCMIICGSIHAQNKAVYE